MVVWPDNDPDGRRYGREDAALVHKAGASGARIVQLAEGMPAQWDLADPVPRGVKDLRTLPEKLAKDTVAYTIGPSPPERPGSSRTPQLPAAPSSQSVREALQHVASDDAPTAFGCGLGLSGDRFPVRAPVLITRPVQASARLDVVVPVIHAVRPAAPSRQSGAERIGKLAFPCLLNADCPNEGRTSAPLGPLCFH